MEQAMAAREPGGSWLEKLLAVRVQVNSESLIAAGLLLAAVLTRFSNLETRVMSHDESLHTFYSWELEQGRGYQHTPLMHGPLQFHLVALSYFLFGDSDASARIPAALAGVAAVALIFVFRQWFGRTGTLVTAGLILISPYMLYYSRYVRNEAFVVVEALLMFWAMFRYYETRHTRWLYLLAIALSLHFLTKETAFLYAGQALLFLAAHLIWRLYDERWNSAARRAGFMLGVTALVIGTSVAMVAYFRERAAGTGAAAESLQPLDPGAEIASAAGLSPLIAVAGSLALVGGILVAAVVVREFGARLRRDFPSLDMLLIIGTLTLPQLAAIPANILGWDPLAFQDPGSRLRTGIVISILVLVSLGIGWAWDIRRWLPIAGAFFLPYFLFYTTLFTNSDGLASGLVGSLGYWLVQHGVERGSQPAYYYALIQVPFYEFLPAIGAGLALWMGIGSFGRQRNSAERSDRFPVMLLFGYWAVTAFLIYSFAGERMPWLTVHIALPLILLSGWAIGKFIDSIDWRMVREGKGWLLAPLGLVFLLAGLRTVGTLLGPQPPFAGSTLAELRATNTFFAAAAVAIGTGVAITALGRHWPAAGLRNLAGLALLTILAGLTARTAARAAYLNGDNATEFLVYAHSATGVKNVMSQIEDLSRRTTDGLAIKVAFDDDVSWPINWYMRNYSQALYYGATPSRDLLNYPVVIAGDNNWGKIDPLLQDLYHSFEYIRMWWPMQDYYGLTWERLANAFGSAQMRGALWQIWFNRDYSEYAEATGRDFSLERWTPSDRMKLYVRKDIAALIWDYGITPAALEAEPYVDPYAEKLITLEAESVSGGNGAALGQLSRPRGVAVAPDGSLYVADTLNHRIQHFDGAGEPLGQWGSFSPPPQEGEAPPPGTFNEPWGVAVAPDGTVYVTDTWNHRIQHFTASGEFLGMFGKFGQAGQPDEFWGPRGLAVDAKGRLFVVDTGNKRVVVFDADGQPVGQFGGFGLQLGGLDEPVGVAIDGQGRVFVADTWNRRVQVFEEVADSVFSAVAEWAIDGWLGQSLENKPYLAVSRLGTVCLSDPEGYRVLCFSPEGEFALGWGGFGAGSDQFGLPVGLTFSASGDLWVVDSSNDRLMRFNIPEAG